MKDALKKINGHLPLIVTVIFFAGVMVATIAFATKVNDKQDIKIEKAQTDVAEMKGKLDVIHEWVQGQISKGG